MLVRETKNRETIVEGQRLRKADTMESKCSILPSSSRRLFSLVLLSSFSLSLCMSPCHVALVLCLVCGVCDTLKNPVCPSKPSPCVRSKRPRVYRHYAHMCFNMCAWYRYTRGRFECTNGGRFERATPHRTRRRRQSCHLPALVFNHFDIQSRRGYQHESHGFSCRLPALVLNNFDIQSTARESHCVNNNSKHRGRR